MKYIPSAPDHIYKERQGVVQPFQFDERVAHVFKDMIRRSVPGYDNLLAMLPVVSKPFVQPHTTLYDLGCSLGAGIEQLLPLAKDAQCQITGIDNSKAMLQRAQTLLDAKKNDVPITLVQANISVYPLQNASVVLLNYTLQFLPYAERQQVIDRIFAALKPGGLLILSEKLLAQDDDILQKLHTHYKRNQGYTALEIRQKRKAIKDILLTDSQETHQNRLLKAGFSKVKIWYQCLNFASFLAIK